MVSTGSHPSHGPLDCSGVFLTRIGFKSCTIRPKNWGLTPRDAWGRKRRNAGHSMWTTTPGTGARRGRNSAITAVAAIRATLQDSATDSARS